LTSKSHITATPCRTNSFAAILESTGSLTFVEPCKQYRSFQPCWSSWGTRVNAPLGFGIRTALCNFTKNRYVILLYALGLGTPSCANCPLRDTFYSSSIHYLPLCVAVTTDTWYSKPPPPPQIPPIDRGSSCTHPLLWPS
jgi:hypothetical protein